MALSIMALSIMALSIMALSIMALSIMALSIMALSIMVLDTEYCEAESHDSGSSSTHKYETRVEVNGSNTVKRFIAPAFEAIFTVKTRFLTLTFKGGGCFNRGKNILTLPLPHTPPLSIPFRVIGPQLCCRCRKADFEN
jgi:hypothetical protein